MSATPFNGSLTSATPQRDEGVVFRCPAERVAGPKMILTHENMTAAWIMSWKVPSAHFSVQAVPSSLAVPKNWGSAVFPAETPFIQSS